MGTGLIFLLPGLRGGTGAAGIGTGLLRGLPGLGGGIDALGIGTGLTDLRRGGADGALFFGAFVLGLARFRSRSIGIRSSSVSSSLTYEQSKAQWQPTASETYQNASTLGYSSR
jgi:hypothetical protein